MEGNWRDATSQCFVLVGGVLDAGTKIWMDGHSPVDSWVRAALDRCSGLLGRSVLSKKQSKEGQLVVHGGREESGHRAWLHYTVCMCINVSSHMSLQWTWFDRFWFQSLQSHFSLCVVFISTLFLELVVDDHYWSWPIMVFCKPFKPPGCQSETSRADIL